MNRWVWVVLTLCGCGAEPVVDTAPSMPAPAKPGRQGPGCQEFLGGDAYRQGEIVRTGRPLDVALHGPGYFRLQAIGTALFTRDGHFTVDEDAYLTERFGYRVVGVDGHALKVGPAMRGPTATSTVFVAGNLNANSSIASAWDPTAGATMADTSNFFFTVTVYTALGGATELQTFCRRTGRGTWEWHAMVDGGGVHGGTSGVPAEVASGTATFDTDGALSAFTQTGTFNPIGATEPQPLRFDFGRATSTGGTGFEGMTQFDGVSTLNRIEQDGAAAGWLAEVDVDEFGQLRGAYSNGQRFPLGQLGVSLFPSPHALRHVHDGLLIASETSGDAMAGAPGIEGRATIVPASLETIPVNAEACVQ